MAQGVEREGHPFMAELEEIQRSTGSSFRLNNLSSRRSSGAFSMRDRDQDEEHELQWAAIERLPTIDRVKSSLFMLPGGEGGERDPKEREPVDVTKLGALEKRLFIDNLIKHIEDDNLRLLQKQKERMERVKVKLPTIEVKYENLTVEAECEVVDGKPLPTLWNTAKSFFMALSRLLPSLKKKGHRVLIFSQWTSMLDILEWTLDVIGVTYSHLDGSTQVSERQSLVDDFNNDPSIFACCERIEQDRASSPNSPG